METIKFKNYTPHTIKLNSGEEYKSIGVARVSANFGKFNSDGICKQEFGEVENLPEPQKGVCFIVSNIVKSASNRSDLVAPATGHPETKRNEKGHILSVPGFVK